MEEGVGWRRRSEGYKLPREDVSCQFLSNISEICARRTTVLLT
jgi:hypothetical protein